MVATGKLEHICVLNKTTDRLNGLSYKSETYCTYLDRMRKSSPSVIPSHFDYKNTMSPSSTNAANLYDNQHTSLFGDPVPPPPMDFLETLDSHLYGNFRRNSLRQLGPLDDYSTKTSYGVANERVKSPQVRVLSGNIRANENRVNSNSRIFTGNTLMTTNSMRGPEIRISSGSGSSGLEPQAPHTESIRRVSPAPHGVRIIASNFENTDGYQNYNIWKSDRRSSELSDEFQSNLDNFRNQDEIDSKNKRIFHNEPARCLRQPSNESYSSSEWFKPSSEYHEWTNIPRLRPSSKNVMSINHQQMRKGSPIATFIRDSNTSSSGEEKISSELVKIKESSKEQFNTHASNTVEMQPTTVKYEENPPQGLPPSGVIIKSNLSEPIFTNAINTGSQFRANPPRPHKKPSFTIIAERSPNASRPQSPVQGRASPFFGRGFKDSSRAQSSPVNSTSTGHLKLPFIANNNIITSDSPRPSVQFNMSSTPGRGILNLSQYSSKGILQNRIDSYGNKIITQSEKGRSLESLPKISGTGQPPTGRLNKSSLDIYSDLQSSSRRMSINPNPTSQQRGLLGVYSSADNSPSRIPIRRNLVASLDDLRINRRPSLSPVRKDRRNSSISSERRSSSQTEPRSSIASDRRSSNLSSVTTSDFSFRRSFTSPTKTAVAKTINSKENTGYTLGNYLNVRQKKPTIRSPRKVAKPTSLSPIIGTPNKEVSQSSEENENMMRGRKLMRRDSVTKIPVRDGSSLPSRSNSRINSRVSSRAPSLTSSRANSPSKDISLPHSRPNSRVTSRSNSRAESLVGSRTQSRSNSRSTSRLSQRNFSPSKSRTLSPPNIRRSVAKKSRSISPKKTRRKSISPPKQQKMPSMIRSHSRIEPISLKSKQKPKEKIQTNNTGFVRKLSPKKVTAVKKNPTKSTAQKSPPSAKKKTSSFNKPEKSVKRTSSLVRKESNLKKETSNMKRAPSNLKRESSNIKREPSNLKREPSNLKREPSNLKTEPSNLKREPSNLKREPSNLKRESSNLKREPSNLKREPSNLKRAPSNLKRESSNLKKNETTLKREPSNLKKSSALNREPTSSKIESGAKLKRESSNLIKNRTDSNLSKKLEKKDSFKSDKSKTESTANSNSSSTGDTSKKEDTKTDSNGKAIKTNVLSMTTAAIADQPVAISATIANPPPVNKSNSSGQLNVDTLIDEFPAAILEKSQKTLENIQKTVTEATDEIHKTINENLNDLKTLENKMGEDVVSPAPFEKSDSSKTITGSYGKEQNNAHKAAGEPPTPKIINSSNGPGGQPPKSPLPSSQPIEANVSVLNAKKSSDILLHPNASHDGSSSDNNNNGDHNGDMTERVSERAISVLPEVECESANLQNYEPGGDIEDQKSAENKGHSTNLGPQGDGAKLASVGEDKKADNNGSGSQEFLGEEKSRNCCGRSKCGRFCCIPCRRMSNCCKCCSCCKSNIDSEVTAIATKENEKTSFWNKCCKKKNKNGSGIEEKMQTKKMESITEEHGNNGSNGKQKQNKCRLCLNKLFCCRATNKVETTSDDNEEIKKYCCCIPCKRKKKDKRAWQERRESIISDPPPRGGRCTRLLDKLKCWKKKKLETESRRASLNSKKQSIAPTLPPEDNRQKLHVDLVEFNSKMKGAIPVMPLWIAWFCAICNTLVPGVGTLLSGLFCLCVGIPRFSQYDSAKARFGSFVINCIVSVSQLFCVLFCLVGWGWSIWWGSIMLRTARKLKKIKHVERLELEEEQRQAAQRATIERDAEAAKS